MTNSETLVSPRIRSIDILRGLVMMIMALDHVRDFFHIAAITGNPTDLQTTTPQLFFTRWITHFCAPTFVFLSGASAFLSGRKKTQKDLSAFLIKRGLWLVLVEMLIITLGLTFNPLYNVLIWQVIWAIGWSMVILGLLVRLPIIYIAIIGFAIVVGHNITDYLTLPKDGIGSVLWTVLVTSRGAFYPIGQTHVIGDFYAILPWTGLMLVGYSFGSYFSMIQDPELRKKRLLIIGFIVVLTFVILRFINKYGDPIPWAHQKNAIFTLLSFLNVTKYPCSLMYCCMTIGPAILFLALIENVQNAFTKITTVYGRVPFFYYVLHFYIIHLLLVVIFFATGYGVKDIIPQNSPFLFRPNDFGFPLWVVYLIWLSVVALLYRPCKWFSKYKQTHSQWWLSYL